MQTLVYSVVWPSVKLIDTKIKCIKPTNLHVSTNTNNSSLSSLIIG